MGAMASPIYSSAQFAAVTGVGEPSPYSKAAARPVPGLKSPVLQVRQLGQGEAGTKPARPTMGPKAAPPKVQPIPPIRPGSNRGAGGGGGGGGLVLPARRPPDPQARPRRGAGAPPPTPTAQGVYDRQARPGASLKSPRAYVRPDLDTQVSAWQNRQGGQQ
jgi:hypothetical protein